MIEGGASVDVEETVERLSVAGTDVGVRRWGMRNGREIPLVLLHGFTGSSASWRPLARLLCARRSVVAIDLPGHGLTEPDHGGPEDAFERTVELVGRACEAAGHARFALGGYSLGGRVALYFALARPARVAALVAESASPGIASDVERMLRRAADEDLARAALRDGVARFVERWEQLPVLAGQRTLAAEARAELRRERLACSALGLASSLRTLGVGLQPYLGDRLGDVAMPVLLVAGARDHKFATAARDMGSRITDSDVVVVEDAGHSVHLERPTELARLVERFLDQTRARERVTTVRC